MEVVVASSTLNDDSSFDGACVASPEYDTSTIYKPS